MRNWTKLIGRAALVATGLAMAGAGTAAAEPRPLYGGSEVGTPVSAPVNLCGNGAAATGVTTAWCDGGATVVGEGRGPAGKSLLGGTRYNSPVSLPANLCGNAGDATSVTRTWCDGGAHVDGTGGARAVHGGRDDDGTGDKDATGGLLPGGLPPGILSDLLGSLAHLPRPRGRRHSPAARPAHPHARRRLPRHGP
ncbi:hypothetical protein AB0881_29410, partial [Spirillospora sp. NPDC029432]